MEEQNPTGRVLVAVVEGRRQGGRVKLRWEDGVMEDGRKLGERNWRNAARNRDSWEKLLKKALAQKGAVVPMMMMMIITMHGTTTTNTTSAYFSETNLPLTQLLQQLLHIYKIYKIYTLKH